MKNRILTSVVIVVVLIGAFLSKMATPYFFDVIIGMLAVIAAGEVAKVLERDYKFNNVYLATAFVPCLYVGIALGIINSWRFDAYLLLILSLILFFSILCFISVFVFKTVTKREMDKYMFKGSVSKYAFRKTMNTLLVYLYPTMFFMSLWFANHIVELPTFSSSFNLSDLSVGFFVLLTIFLVSIITDTFAMLFGMLLKGPKLAPKISPKKTISGAIGGLLGGILIAFIVYAVLMTQDGFVTFVETANVYWWHILLLGLIGSIISQIGDLFASLIKRHARVKDYGTIFPGHGGVMDRVDGLIFNSVFVMIFMLLLV